MKLLHVVPTYLPAWRYGGTIRSVHGLCRELAVRGHEVHVFTTDVDGASRSGVPVGVPCDVDGVKVRYFDSPFLRRTYFSPAMASELGARIRDFDLVHLHSVFLWPTSAAAARARRAGVPYVVSPRGMMVKDLFRRKSGLLKSAWTACFERRNLEGAAAVHVTSALEAEELARFGFSLRRTFVVPNGVDLPSGAPRVETGRPTVLFLGRVNWKKGLDRLVAAMKAVPEAELVIAGNDEEGYRAELEKSAHEAGVSGRVRFTGEVRGAEKDALLRSASLLALPSHSENFGNVVLEAMAEGCPVLVSPHVGLASAVLESGSGVVVSNDAEALGAALSKMLSDPAALGKMGEAGRRTVRERFAWSAVAARMEEEYRLIAGKGAR